MSPAIREAARAVVLDDRDRIVLVHWVNEDNAVDLWLTPGGGVDDGEDREAALRRELREELGLEEFEPGPVIWTRRHRFPWYDRVVEQREEFVLVRVRPFELRPEPEALDAEGVREARWWTLTELEHSTEAFAPMRIADLLRELLASGPPPDPIDAGV